MSSSRQSPKHPSMNHADEGTVQHWLARLLERFGWRLHQKGRGTQIGWVGGNVIINNYHGNRAGRAGQQPTAADVLALLDALEPYGKREAMLDFMAAQFGTRRVVDLDALALRRTWAYARTTLDHERWGTRRNRGRG